MSAPKKPPLAIAKRPLTAEEWAGKAEMATTIGEGEPAPAPESPPEPEVVPAPAPAPIARPAPASPLAAPVIERVVKRQVNIEVPETLHLQLKAFVKTLPDMNVTKFLLLAAQKEMTRVEKERER